MSVWKQLFHAIMVARVLMVLGAIPVNAGQVILGLCAMQLSLSVMETRVRMVLHA